MNQLLKSAKDAFYAVAGKAIIFDYSEYQSYRKKKAYANQAYCMNLNANMRAILSSFLLKNE